MGSLNPPEFPALDSLELIGPKGYFRWCFPFELPEDYDADEILGYLKAGYNGAARRLPILRCEAIPDKERKQAGVLKPKLLKGAEDFETITAKDLRNENSLPTYSELKKKGFPVSAFDAKVFCRRGVWPAAGERLPICQVQANFIRGGLILSWCILHMFGDGTSFYVWTKLWAEETLRAQGLEVRNPVNLDEAIFKGREVIMKPSGHNKGRLEDHPEYTLLPFTPSGAPPKMCAPNHRGQVFYFSPESLKALKEAASPSHATDPHDKDAWISTNDALSALLWRAVMAAQWPVESLKDDPTSVYNIAIDGRTRTDPPVNKETLGCWLEYVAASCPIRKMLTTASLADIALLVRKAVAKADKNFTDDVVTIVDHLTDVDRLVPTAFLDVPGHNCIESSWIGFALYDLDWGQKLGGKIQAVRAPSCGVINGLQVVLPRVSDGGLEVLVGVEEKNLGKLMQDPLWLKYAEPR